MLGDEELHLAQSDAVLAGAGAVHGQRAHDQAIVQALGFLEFLRIVAVDQEAQMEIAVADVADQRRDQETLLQILLGFQ